MSVQDSATESVASTILSTDIEGSTRLLQALGPDYAPSVDARHRAILRACFERHGGAELGTEGDSFMVAFVKPSEAVQAAFDGQIALAEERWPPGVSVRVRMGLHTGVAYRAADGLIGLTLHQAARIGVAAHGGQVLASSTTADVWCPSGATWASLGTYSLKDIPPIELRELRHDDLSPVDKAPRLPPPGRTNLRRGPYAIDRARRRDRGAGRVDPH